MVQGNRKLGKARKSSGSLKKKGGKAVKHKRKGSSKIENNKAHIQTSKAINKKNERLVAAKALNSGTNFFLKDIAERGKSEGQRQKASRDKKQNKPTKLSERLNIRLNKLR